MMTWHMCWCHHLETIHSKKFRILIYPKIRWSLKNEFSRVINLGINPVFSQIPSSVLLSLQIDILLGIFFVNKPFFSSWNRYALKIRLKILHEKPYFCAYICFNYRKKKNYQRKTPRIYQFATIAIPLRVFHWKKDLYQGWSRG